MRGIEVRMNNRRMHEVLRNGWRTLWPSKLGAWFLWDKKRPPERLEPDISSYVHVISIIYGL
jgi:hypothetical protein